MSTRRESRLRSFAAKVRGFLRGRKHDGEFDDEVQEHLKQLADKFEGQGISREEAAAAARRQFGNLTLLQEDRRDLQTFVWTEALFQDLRHGFRRLLKDRSFTLLAVLVLALGIGANTTLFTVVRSVLLKPLPFENPDELVMLYEQSADRKHAYNVVAGGIFQQWQEQSRSFEQMAIVGGSGYNLSGANGALPEKLEGGKCSWNLFSTLGVRPAYGRVFS